MTRTTALPWRKSGKEIQGFTSSPCSRTEKYVNLHSVTRQPWIAAFTAIFVRTGAIERIATNTKETFTLRIGTESATSRFALTVNLKCAVACGPLTSLSFCFL